MLLNENQMEYLENSNKKFNVKAFALFSGAHYVDMNYVIQKRAEDLKDVQGKFLMVFPSKKIAKARLQQAGIDWKNRPILSFEGTTVHVIISSEKVKKFQHVLDIDFKYLYVDHMEELNKTLLEKLLQKAREKEDTVLDGTIGGVKVIPELIEFLTTEENLYYQENFTTENNTIFPANEKAYLIEHFSEDAVNGFKLEKFLKNKVK